LSATLVDSLREPARTAPESGIVEVVNYARNREDLIPLWVGEGDLPTPEFLCAAANKSLAAGETFYTYQRGIPELRQALADYHANHYGRAFSPERFFVTGSGMQAIQLAVQCIAGAGDEVIVPSPAWPNVAAAVEVMGAKAVPVTFDFHPDGWQLDLDKVFAAVTPRTRAIFLNTPCNPTGWVAAPVIIRKLLNEARKRGIWIIADEVYGRFYYGDGERAPSFYDFAEDQDRIIFVNTFSKNWAMTGWRIGWMSVSPELGQVVENLIQYSTSGVAQFMQRAAVEALTNGETFLKEQIARARNGKQIITQAFSGNPQIRFADTKGAFYMFFGIEGYDDPRQLALELVRETGVGLAPGTAFGSGGGGFLRLCFLRCPDQLEEAARRIAQWTAR